MAEESVSVFLSYSRNDREMLDQLNKHLAGLKRTNKIRTWDDRDIEPGSEWELAIQAQLDAADIIILLISADFINSDYCYCKELQRAIERHNTGEACVIPVILKPCLWNLPDIPFSKLNVLPDHARPITKWEDSEEAFATVAQHISNSIESLRQRRLEWIQKIREHCCQKILNQYSRMRLLSGEEIGVDQLYVDVYLLNRSPRTFLVSPNKMLETFDLRNDRLGLGDRIKRNPGFEVANNNSKLVILGKPGSGKTTFLKHLAVDWCKGQFQPDSIAVLIELRRIQDEQWHVFDAIDQELGLDNWQRAGEFLKQIRDLQNLQKKKDEDKSKQINELQQQVKKARQPVETLLKQGKLLVLTDGLDEVPTIQVRGTVQEQLEQVAKEYTKSRLILTCRTQIMATIPIGFTSVEVADFSEEQVKQFVVNWFTASGKSDAEAVQQWETFNQSVSSNPALKELTTTPVLLSLMCWVFQDEGEIPSQQNWLYQKGTRLLLSRWNDSKQIEGWEVGIKTYRQLDIEQKEALLTEIAARKFENPDNFVLFQQKEISAQITQFLQLANPKQGVAVLKAIEAQHGLLVERADELWSFSHLTFQEYFTVQWLTQLSPETLAEKIASKQWQEAVNQIVKSQQPADRLIQLIKQAIDRSIACEPELQKFLAWVLQKSESITVCRKPAAARALYFDLEIDRALTRVLLDLGLAHDLDPAFDHTRSRDYNVDFDRALVRALALAINRDRTLALSLDLDHNIARALVRALAFDIDCALALDVDCTLTHDLTDKLKQFKAALPPDSIQNLLQWWKSNGVQWLEQLRQVMIEHRNIGHDWQFNKVQTQQLQRYYDVNKFLVELMKIEGAVSNTVRDEIEDNLLLPWEELQRRQRR